MGFSLRARERRSLRRAVRTDCQVVMERPFELLSNEALDVSPEGMLVATNDTPPVGEPLIVSLRAPGTRLWVDAEATVARIVYGRGIGLRFRRMDAAARALLEASLHGHPPPVPEGKVRLDYAAAVRSIAGV